MFILSATINNCSCKTLFFKQNSKRSFNFIDLGREDYSKGILLLSFQFVLPIGILIPLYTQKSFERRTNSLDDFNIFNAC